MKIIIWLIVFVLIIAGLVLGGLWYLGGQTALPVATSESGEAGESLPPLNLAEATAPAVQFSASDLTTVASTTAQSPAERAADYITSLYEILDNYATGMEEGALITFQSYLASPNPAELEKLKRNATHHSATVKQLLALPAPVEFQEKHLELTNNLTELTQIIFGLSEVEADPVVALAYSEKYPEQYSKFLGASFAIYRHYLEVAELSTVN